MGNLRALSLLTGVIIGSSFAALPSAARAGATLRIDDTKSITMGLGLRAFATADAPGHDGSPDLNRVKSDFVLDNALLGLTGQMSPEVKLQLNVVRQPTG